MTIKQEMREQVVNSLDQHFLFFNVCFWPLSLDILFKRFVSILLEFRPLIELALTMCVIELNSEIILYLLNVNE